ncbi:MAG: hypothetical protein KF845_03770 [Cyclobacteriaceae bacterium]|nr:hypothetical protein [Cyclobacteriaceae bacterium]
MSSHHVVKEDQEPALLIADASATPFPVVQELLEWSPTIIVLEQALPDVLLWGIKIDVVICRQNNVDRHVTTLNDQAPVKVLSHPDNENPLPTACYFLIAAKYCAVNVLGAGFEMLEPFAAHLDVVTFCEHKRWLYVRNGKFEKWITRGAKILFPPTVISVDGLDANGVAANDGTIRIVSDSAFWVGEEI